MFELVEIGRLVGASDNLRRSVGNVAELAASIRSIGVLEPLLVTPAADGFAVVAGHRRLAAARKAGLEMVPCVIREMSEVDRVVAMVVENEQRSDLSPIEAADGYFRLIDMGVTQKELAKRVGRSAKHVGSRLALLELPRTVRTQIHAGRLSLTAAAALLELVDDPGLIEEIASGDPADVERAVLRHHARHSAQPVGEDQVEGDVDVEHDEADLDGGPSREPEHDDDNGGGADGDEAASSDPADKDVDVDGDVVVESEWQRRARERSEVEAARRKAMVAARTARTAFIDGLLQRRVPKGDATAHVAATVIETASSVQARLACRWIGLEPVEGRFGPDHRTALNIYSASSVGNRDRAVLAICLARGEEAARGGHSTTLGCGFIEFLATFGYEPTAGDPRRNDGDADGRSTDAA